MFHVKLGVGGVEKFRVGFLLSKSLLGLGYRKQTTFILALSSYWLRAYLPTRATVLVWMMKYATPASSVPMVSEPTTSARGFPVYPVMVIHVPAIRTPTTAARSSMSTTFTDGSWPRPTEQNRQVHSMNSYFSISHTAQ